MTYKRFLKFSVVGAVNTGIDFGVFAALIYGMAIPVVGAHITGFLLAVVNSYLMNKFWTFSNAPGQAKWQTEFSLFIGTVGLGLVLTTAIIWGLEPYLHPLLAKAATIVVSLGWNFTLSHFIVFRAHRF